MKLILILTLLFLLSTSYFPTLLEAKAHFSSLFTKETPHYSSNNLNTVMLGTWQPNDSLILASFKQTMGKTRLRVHYTLTHSLQVIKVLTIHLVIYH
jgi:hypothetical protein